VEKPLLVRSALTDFLREQGTPQECIGEVFSAIEDALLQFDRSIVTPRPELAEKARQLDQDIQDIKQMIESPAKLKRLVASLNPSSELWFFLRLTGTLAHGDLGSPEGLEEGHTFDRLTASRKDFVDAVKKFEDTLDRINAVRMLDWIAAAARRATEPKAGILSRRGAPMDEARLMLGLELAHIWRYSTGEPPTFSSEAVPESPGTKFGRFVSLVAQMSPSANEKLKKGFSHFVRAAVEHFVVR
jgi:hypothetical protein